MAASLSSHASWTLCPAASSTSCICFCEESLAISEFLRLAESRAISLSCRDAATAAKPAPAACLVVCPAAVHSGQGPAARCGRIARFTALGLCCVEMKYHAAKMKVLARLTACQRAHTKPCPRLTAASHVFARGRDTRTSSRKASQTREGHVHTGPRPAMQALYVPLATRKAPPTGPTHENRPSRLCDTSRAEVASKLVASTGAV